jgi:predicted DNA-binding transcriptional regulator YafY
VRRADRLFQVVQILRRDRLTTASRIARELGVAERTIYRDVRDLSASGVPVESEAGVGYRLPRHFDLPPITFTPDEVEALVLGARITQAWGGDALSGAARSALARIEAVLPPRLRERLSGASLFAPAFHVPRRTLAHLEALRLAVRERRKVRVAYARADGEKSERVLRPLGLFFWGTTWSLAAWCEMRDGFRTFRLDRIRALTHLAETFEAGPGQTLGDYARLMEAEEGPQRS